MCPLVVESSISSSSLRLAVNDGQSQSHQLDSTSSTGNPAAPLPDNIHMDTLTARHIYTQWLWHMVRQTSSLLLQTPDHDPDHDFIKTTAMHRQ